MSMTNLGRCRRVLLVAACLILSALSGPRAEVAVAAGATPGAGVSLYIVQIIVDDGDPIDTAWISYNGSGEYVHVLNPDGFANGDGKPSLLRNRFSGLPMVAWSRNSPAGYDVVISSFTGGAWSEPVVLAGSAADEFDPVLVMDPEDGTVHLLYWIDDATPRVMHRQAPADLSSWTSPVQVSQPGDAALRPSGVVHGGTLQVAYELHSLGLGVSPRQLMMARKVGASFETDFVATMWHSGANWPEVHSAGGELWVDWVDTVNEMTWVEADGAGGWGPVEIEPYGSVEDRDFNVRTRIRAQATD